VGKRNDDDAFYWRSIRMYKVNLIRYALHKSNGVIKEAAVELGISFGGLRKEISALEASGLQVRPNDFTSPVLAPPRAEEATPAAAEPQKEPDGTHE
jgi:hypothetical protein